MTTALALIAALLQTPASQPASQPAASQPTANLAHTAPFEMGKAAKAHSGAAFTIDAKKAVSLDAIAKAPKDFAGKTVRVNGKVQSVCKKKGCWLVLAGTAATSRARITFKDYGFYAPRDSAGTMATVEGTVEVKTLSEAERKHLADDAGKPVKDIPAAELRLIANAIEVQRVGH